MITSAAAHADLALGQLLRVAHLRASSAMAPDRAALLVELLAELCGDRVEAR